MQRLKDKALLYKIQIKKDHEAFAVVYDTHGAAIFRFVKLKVADTRDAEDITSEVFLKTWRYLTEGEKKSVQSIRGFLYQVARNHIVDWYRKQAKGNAATVPLHEIDEHRGALPKRMAEEGDIGGFEETMLLRALRSLKEEYQEVVFLRYVEELSLSEIARLLNKRQVTVRVTLSRALKKLHEILHEKR